MVLPNRLLPILDLPSVSKELTLLLCIATIYSSVLKSVRLPMRETGSCGA